MIGQTLSHYKITAKLGEGGMGEVYRATDTKLNRDVALKVLPEAFAADRERMTRFSREAQVLASLNHPNIASIYGLEDSDDKHALVLELVEGETLAERIQKGAIPLEESLNIALQMAEALEAAHEKGIIHRDLKPANVKITPEGKVKVLDFGLAKALEDETPATDLTSSPTRTGTAVGVIMGTAGYMSPEQARGQAVDKRTDIWAFGCVLYEMLTGKQVFGGETVTDILAAIVHEDPDWEALPEGTPRAIQRLLRRCLQKDPHDRLRHIGDAGIEVREALSDPFGVTPLPVEAPLPQQSSWRQVLPWAMAGILAVGLGLGTWNALRGRSPQPGGVTRWDIDVPPGTSLGGEGLVLAPDGSRAVFALHRKQTTQLYAREMAQLDVTPLRGTEGASNPFFSPNGEWIGFFAENRLNKIAAGGGPPVPLADARSSFGGSWTEDETIVYAPSYSGGLRQVSADRGPAIELTPPDSAAGVLGHWWPQVLPGGRAVLFTIFSTPIETARIGLLFLETGEQRVLIEGGVFARYLLSGHMVYARGETLMAVPFDLTRLMVTGSAVPVVGGVRFEPSEGQSHYSVSEGGSLAYAPPPDDRMLAWIDKETGEVQRISGEYRRFADPRLSPDGQRVALTIQGVNPDIWVYDLGRGTFTRLTFGAANEEAAVWTPDGERVIFLSEQPVYDLYWKTADGSGEAELLLASDHDKLPNSVAPDGTALAFTENDPKNGGDLWVLSLDGEGDAREFLSTAFDEEAAAFSQDGNWLAYHSNESGRFEVYVVPYPGLGAKQQISTDGGTQPMWSRGGRELFYRREDEIMAVSIDTTAGFKTGAPRMVTEQTSVGDTISQRFIRGYDATLGGERLLMILPAPDSKPTKPIVVLNWFEELKRLVPTDN